jgi:hypothetical protein
VEEEGSRGETETRRRKEESGRRRDGRRLEESVLEVRGVFLVKDLEGGPGDRVSKGAVRSS